MSFDALTIAGLLAAILSGGLVLGVGSGRDTGRAAPTAPKDHH
jgi:hypothetical protein